MNCPGFSCLLQYYYTCISLHTEHTRISSTSSSYWRRQFCETGCSSISSISSHSMTVAKSIHDVIKDKNNNTRISLFPAITLNIKTSSEKQKNMPTVFWHVTPCGLVEVCQGFEGTYCLHLQDRTLSPAKLASCLIYSSTLKTEEESPSETSVNYQTTRSHIPDDSVLHHATFYFRSLSSRLLSRNNFACSFGLVWNLVSRVKRRIATEIGEQRRMFGP
jgi:hypothetical protein